MPLFAHDVPLSDAQQVVGWLEGIASGSNTVMVLCILLGLASASVLFRHVVRWLLTHLRQIPAEVYEVLGYSACATAIVGGHSIGDLPGSWIGLIGCLATSMGLSMSMKRRTVPSPFAIALLHTALWTTTAAWYGSELLGFFAVLGWMHTLGFLAAALPFCFIVGFHDEDALGRTTVAAMVLLTSVAAAHLFDLQLGALSAFDWGVQWVCSFTLFLGLLISASRWYRTSMPWMLRQAVFLATTLAAIAAATTAGLPPIRGMAVAFFILWLVEKPFDLRPSNEVALASCGLASSLVGGSLAWWCYAHADQLARFLDAHFTLT